MQINIPARCDCRWFIKWELEIKIYYSFHTLLKYSRAVLFIGTLKKKRVLQFLFFIFSFHVRCNCVFFFRKNIFFSLTDCFSLFCWWCLLMFSGGGNVNQALKYIGKFPKNKTCRKTFKLVFLNVGRSIAELNELGILQKSLHFFFNIS